MAKTFSLRNEDAPSTTEANVFELFAEIASHLREQRGATCRCGSTGNWQATLDIEHKVNGDQAVVNNGCSACSHVGTVTISRRAIRDIGQAILDEKRWQGRLDG